nr:AraC family transcriptional regulator [Rhodococcus sp. (in: high G+C Gram-positive bacteria)]
MKPLARYASLTRYVELCAETGVDAGPELNRVGLSLGGLAVPGQWVPAVSVVTLLENSAAVSGRDDFGLRMATSRRLSNLGMLSVVLREEPDVRSALNVLIRYEHTYNEALRIRLIEGDGVARVRIWLELGHPTPDVQSLDLAAGVTCSLLREILDDTWQPVTVCLQRDAPRKPDGHRRAFGSEIVFNCAATEIMLQQSDLDRPNRLADKLLQPHAKQVLESLPQSGTATVSDRVCELIELLLPVGRCSVEQVAHSLGVDRRTVHRKLAESDTTFTELVNSVRKTMATQFLPNPRYSMIDISVMLGFSTPGSFSRWFRSQSGEAPSDWRRAHWR